MWTRIKDFDNSNKYAIWWTIGYIVVTWAIMRYMFNFNIFSLYRWHQLMHAHLHGFAGLVFGILILAMVPLYVATTIVIARTKSPLFNFTLTIPEFIKNAFIQTPLDEPAPESSAPESEPQPESAPDTPATPQPESESDAIPAELRVAYARARDHISRTPTSAFDLGNVTKSPTTPTTEPDPVSPAPDMPIPTDFDITDTEKIINDVPVFTDINFDDDESDNDESETPELTDIETTIETNDAVTKYLDAKSVPYKTDGDVIITDKFAIVSHTDSDFWVADNESWFAAGKIRHSPIASVLAVAATNNVQPVLYLGADNIMDIDDLRHTWESAGIRIITDMKDLM